MQVLNSFDEQPTVKSTLPLIDSNHQETGISRLRGVFFNKLTNLVLAPVAAGVNHDLPDPIVFSPHADSRRYGTTHFGIMISDLPAPHYFLACASMLGCPSMRAFDIDCAVTSQDGPRNTVVLSHGTAAATQRAFTHYSLKRDIVCKDDGSLLRFGEDMEISGSYPDFRLKSQREDFAVDLNLTATGEITWFAKGAVYEHLSLLTRYNGTLSHAGKTMQVSGLCTYEYARGSTPYLFSNRLLPFKLKYPWDVFNYQVINLDANTQLLFAHCAGLGQSVLTSAYLRIAGQTAYRIAGDVHFQVHDLQSDPGVAPDGSTTQLPNNFSWTVRAADGQSLFEINAEVDTPMLFGLGMGFIGGYNWTGTREGVPIKGRGYLEYIDQRRFGND